MLLAIDTSAGTSVAVVDGGRVVAERATDDTMRHAEAIGVLLREALAAAGAAPIAVVAGMGPGPFTGLRVGIAAARAFALGRGIPVLPLVSHDAVAFERLTAGEPADDLLVVTDARRRERYWSRYRGLTADGVPRRVEGPALAKPDDLPPAGERLEAAAVSAGALGRLAERHRAAGIPFAEPRPLYLRSPDVTLPAGRKRVTR